MNPFSCGGILNIVDRLFMSYKTKGENLRMSLRESLELCAMRQGNAPVGRLAAKQIH